MNNAQIRWILVGSLALGLSACDVSVGKCERDDAGECVDLFPDDEDAGDEEDAGGLDDGGGADGGDDSGADGGAGEGGADGGSDAETGPAISVREFCEMALEPGQAWVDRMDTCCSSAAAGSPERNRLVALLGYPSGGPSACEDRQQGLIDSGNVTFDGRYAAACARAFAAHYDLAPPDDCPSGEGFFLPSIESMVGHGAQLFQQIPVCRQAFAGTLPAGAVCTDDFHCSGTRVCATGSGARTCQDPVPEGGSCERAADCASGTTCKGNEETGGGRRCTAIDDLGLNGANCTSSAECINGLVCAATTLTCTEAPQPDDYKASGTACAMYECQGFCDSSSNQCTAFCAE